MKFKATDLQGVLYGEEVPDFSIIENKPSRQSRWSVHYTLIFSYKDKYYKTSYSRGATEYQDEGPFEYETEVECQEVKPVEKVVIVYE